MRELNLLLPPESCRPKQQPGVVVVPIFSNVMAGQGLEALIVRIQCQKVRFHISNDGRARASVSIRRW